MENQPSSFNSRKVVKNVALSVLLLSVAAAVGVLLSGYSENKEERKSFAEDVIKSKLNGIPY